MLFLKRIFPSISENNLLFLDIKKHFLGTLSDSGKRRKISIEKRNSPDENEFSREKKNKEKKIYISVFEKKKQFQSYASVFSGICREK